MIRHILFLEFHGESERGAYTGGIPSFYAAVSGYDEWKYRGALHAEINRNFAGGYDLVFYAEFADEESLKKFMNHPLHVAHREKMQGNCD